VKAVEAGTVEAVMTYGTYGLIIIVSHGGGYRSLYGQLNSARVEVGQAVIRGQTIAASGGANSPEGPHLYLEIRGENLITLDPSDWLRTRR
jgi:flagellar protein FlgJ